MIRAKEVGIPVTAMRTEPTLFASVVEKLSKLILKIPGNDELWAETSATSSDVNSVPPSHEAAENKANVRTNMRRESARCAFARSVGSTILASQLGE